MSKLEEVEFAGFHRLRHGRIHLYCPSCGLKRSNVERDPYDPPNAALAHLPCERCSEGCKVDGPSAYLTKHGRFLTSDEIDRHIDRIVRTEEGAKALLDLKETLRRLSEEGE
jgi:hypothetical protein